MNNVRRLREIAGLTQQELAEAAGTSQSAVAAYERGAKSPTLRTVQRLAEAAGLQLDLRYVPRLTREDRRSLALHHAIADKLIDQPTHVLSTACNSLHRMRQLHAGAEPLLNQWHTLLQGPLHALVPVLTDLSPWARELRQVTPFTGALTAPERARVYRAFSAAERARNEANAEEAP